MLEAIRVSDHLSVGVQPSMTSTGLLSAASGR